MSKIAERFTAVASHEAVEGFEVDLRRDGADAAVEKTGRLDRAEMVGVVFVNGRLQIDDELAFGDVVRLHPVDGVVSRVGDDECV